MTAIKSYKDLDAWQLGMELAFRVYRETENFPLREQFGLTAQLRRCAVSVPSNVAEGHNRRMDRPYRNHLSIALGSTAEIETQVEVARRLGFISGETASAVLDLSARLGRVLQGLFSSLGGSRD